jgi:hypothetical protein
MRRLERKVHLPNTIPSTYKLAMSRDNEYIAIIFGNSNISEDEVDIRSGTAMRSRA